MFISKKFSSAILCSTALLAMVGCSDGVFDESESSGQANNQVSAAQTQSPGTSNTQNGRSFSGTTRGQVSAVNADGSLVVLGQTIFVSTNTLYFGVTRSDLMVGDYISIESSVDGSGRIVAGAITLDTSFDPVVTLMGVVTHVDFDDQYFQIGDITVAFDDINFANFDSTKLSSGMVVEITANEQNFDAGFSQIAVDTISVLENGSTVTVGLNGVSVSDNDSTVVVNQSGVSVSDNDGSVVVGPDGVIVNESGDSVIVGENGVSINDDGAVVVGPEGVLVNVDGNTVVVGEEGVSVNADGTVVVGPTGISVNAEGTVGVGTSGITVNAENETIVVGESGVTIDGSEGTSSVTTDGITINGNDLEDVINDTVNDTLNESLDNVLDLGDLGAYNYSDIQLSTSSNCLSIDMPTTFQVTGTTTNSSNETVTHNLSGQVSINSDSPGNLSLVANDSTGIYLNMNEQDIVAMEIVAGDTTLTHFVGAIPDTVARPVVLAKHTSSWCSFIIFEQDNCTSITNTTPDTSLTTGQTNLDTGLDGTTLNAGQTVVDTSSAGTTISVAGEVLIDAPSNQWVSETGVVDSVSSHSGLTVTGCTLTNPENIPVVIVK